MADYKPVEASEYLPMEIGRYVDYDLDSTVFLNFGKNEATIHYQAREVVQDSFLDNQGRKSFKVVRYLRSGTGQEWQPSITYSVTPAGNRIEVVENNLRFIKLASPVKENYSWKGNHYIDTYSTELDVNYLEDWDYIYEEVGQPLSYGSNTFDNTISVFQRDEFNGRDPSLPETLFAEKTVANEKYAKGIGLIYREFLHWRYQGNGAYYEGYGIKMTVTGYGKL